MPLKVTWKKGMRLSTEVFDALDMSCDENIRLSNMIATGGRYGLIPAYKPFELSVNINDNILEVVSLSCHGVTKSGRVVDIDFDSNYTNTFDTRIAIPTSDSDGAFLLVIKYHDQQWREVNEMFSEPLYTFEIIGVNSPIHKDSLPVGLIVNEYGWRLDETVFVPPCLYVNAHSKYQEQLNMAKLALKSISDKCLTAHDCIARRLLGTVWPTAINCYIDLENRQDALTPADVFASIQKIIASFVIGCSIDEYIMLDNAGQFTAYFQRPYNARNLYRDIQDGLSLCAEINVKMDAVCAMTEVKTVPVPPTNPPKPKPAPTPAPTPAGRNRWEGIEI